MSIPDFETIMKPYLEFLSDGKEKSLSEAEKYLGTHFKLTDEEFSTLLPSGKTRKFYDRLSWAIKYLSKAGLVEHYSRGIYKITAEGKSLLKKLPEKLNKKYLLENYSEIRSFLYKSKKLEEITLTSESPIQRVPEELISDAYLEIKEDLIIELLNSISKISPSAFEQLVINLLVAMGYGGSLKEAGEVVGKSHDGGIDGIIKEDKLGLDSIYIQAKRWDSSVGRQEIQKFVGALAGNKAKKGIFVTTSTFSKEAISYAGNLETKVILIDGNTLAELMVDYNVGVSIRDTYYIKKIDYDYFDELG